MTSDQERMRTYVEVWKSCVDDAVALLRGLDDDDWSKPTDLPGWDVKAVAAHLAHLESELAGHAQDDVEVPELAHVTSPMGRYTERGPTARASWTPGRIIDQLAQATDLRFRQLTEDPPTDAAAVPAITPGDVGWSWETLLRNRPLDVWMHEQDIRRAVGRPGGMNSAGAGHALQVLAMSFPYCVGKRVAPPAGTTVVLDVTGVHPVHLVVEMNAGGRAVPLANDPEEPSVTLAMDAETLTVLGGGRRTPHDVEVAVAGDRALGDAILSQMAVTP